MAVKNGQNISKNAKKWTKYVSHGAEFQEIKHHYISFHGSKYIKKNIDLQNMSKMTLIKCVSLNFRQTSKF